jgi:hypothetical protein
VAGGLTILIMGLCPCLGMCLAAKMAWPRQHERTITTRTVTSRPSLQAGGHTLEMDSNSGWSYLLR